MTADPGANSEGMPTPPYGPPSYGPPTYGPTSPYPPVPYASPVPDSQEPPTTYGQVPYLPPGVGPYGIAPGNPAQGAMLAATADRERTVDVLKAAFIEGRLSQQEFDQRSTRVLAARTYADLNAIIADLPIGPSGVAMPGYYPVVQPPPPMNGLAIGALICGIAEVFTLGLSAIPAVVLGHAARAHIKENGERGDGLAVTGLVLGYLALAGWLIILIGIAGR